jgi:hypothetical protein
VAHGHLYGGGDEDARPHDPDGTARRGRDRDRLLCRAQPRVLASAAG